MSSVPDTLGDDRASAERRKWLVLAGVAIPSFLGCIDFTIVNTALPLLQTALHPPIWALQAVVNAFLLALSASLILAGRMADLFGRRRLLFIGLAAFGAGSILAGAAGSIGWLLAARAIQGAACAILYTTSASIVADAFPEAERGQAIGLLFGINGAGLAIGPAVGGLLAGAFGWRSIFLMNVPFVVVAALLCLAVVSESRVAATGRSDWAGALLLILTTSLLVAGIQAGGARGWTSLAALALLVPAIAAGVALVLVEERAPEPILPVRWIVRPAVGAALIATAALAAFYCSAFFLLPIYLQSVLGLPAEAAGLMLLTATLGVGIFSPIAGRVADRLGVRVLLLGGFAVFAVSAAILALLPVQPDWPLLVAALFLIGLGWAAILGPSTVAAIAALPAEAGALAVGIASTIHNIGGALGLAFATIGFEQAAVARFGAVTTVAVPADAVHRGLTAEPGFAALFADTSITSARLHELFATTFLAGLHAVGWYLFAVSVAAAALIAWLSPHRHQGTPA